MAEDKLIYYLLDKESRRLENHNVILSNILSRMIETQRLERDAVLEADNREDMVEGAYWQKEMKHLHTSMNSNVHRDYIERYGVGTYGTKHIKNPTTKAETYSSNTFDLIEELKGLANTPGRKLALYHLFETGNLDGIEKEEVQSEQQPIQIFLGGKPEEVQSVQQAVEPSVEPSADQPVLRPFATEPYEHRNYGGTIYPLGRGIRKTEPYEHRNYDGTIPPGRGLR